MPRGFHMTVAKASPEQVDTLRTWFHELEDVLEDSEEDAPDIAKFVQDTFRQRRIDEYERILFGYETLVENACDPNLSHLEWKPEIMAAIRAAKTASSG
jgi:hypothetical protein